MKTSNENQIKKVAKKHFVKYGYVGARTQDIADEAKVNKALIHYYYKTKSELFMKVFEEEFINFFNIIEGILKPETPLLKKISQLIDADISHSIQKPDIAMFIMREIAYGEESGSGCGSDGTEVRHLFELFEKSVKNAMAKKEIKKTDARDLFTNILALTTYPFVSKKLLQDMHSLDAISFEKWMTQRKKTTYEFILNNLK
jgi:TetR/AcrR family transcriptional regulator